MTDIQPSFSIRMATMEEFLRKHLPMVSFFNQQGRDTRQRVVFAWDGWRIVPRKVTPLPPPSDADLETAYQGFRDDAASVLAQAGLKVDLPA